MKCFIPPASQLALISLSVCATIACGRPVPNELDHHFDYGAEDIQTLLTEHENKPLQEKKKKDLESTPSNGVFVPLAHIADAKTHLSQLAALVDVLETRNWNRTSPPAAMPEPHTLNKYGVEESTATSDEGGSFDDFNDTLRLATDRLQTILETEELPGELGSQSVIGLYFEIENSRQGRRLLEQIELVSYAIEARDLSSNDFASSIAKQKALAHWLFAPANMAEDEESPSEKLNHLLSVLAAKLQALWSDGHAGDIHGSELPSDFGPQAMLVVLWK